MAKYDSTHLKKMNIKTVFHEFRNKDTLFINEIARSTKISAPTVIKIIDFLLEKKLILELGSAKTTIGRKPNLLKINTDQYFSIGVIYEGEYLGLGIVDLLGNMINFIQVKCGSHFERSILRNIDHLLEMSQKDKKNLMGIGIGIPCIFDDVSKEITAPLIGIEQPKYFGDFIHTLSERYDSKVVVDNDLNLQAYGEFFIRNHNPDEDLIYISLGTGLGAGIITNGNIRKGNRNFCGEIGYMMFEYPEKDASSQWIENKINLQHIQKMFRISDESTEDANKADAIAYVSKYLALIINNLVVSLDISNIVLDGYIFDLLGDELLTQTQEKLNPICYKQTQIKKRSTFSPGVLGGALLASNEWLEEVFEK